MIGGVWLVILKIVVYIDSMKGKYSFFGIMCRVFKNFFIGVI